MGILEREAKDRFGSAYDHFHREYHEHCRALKHRRGDEWDLDGLSTRVRRYCLAGIERVITLKMLSGLYKNFNQIKLAEHLGQKDTSGIRHIKANGSMKGDLWVLMLIEHLEEVVEYLRDDDIIDSAFTEGFLEVFTQVRHKELGLGLAPIRRPAGDTHSTNGQDDAGVHRLTREGIACIRQLFINKTWIDAQKIQDRARRARELESAGKEILDQVFRPSDRNGHAHDAKWLEEMLRDWGESYLLGVGALLDEKESSP